MKVMKGLVIVAVAGSLGCASLPQMRPGMPITIDRSFGTPRYQQEGRGIDPSDVASKLNEEPRSSPNVKGSRALYVLAILAGAAGGALIGTPLGEKAGGDRHPNWTLAAAGGAVLGGGVILSIGSRAALDAAVEQHNRSFDPPGAGDAP